jgi:hypothetical protein
MIHRYYPAISRADCSSVSDRVKLSRSIGTGSQLMDFPRTHGADPESSVVEKHYAVIYVPGKKRARFPENCVRIVDSYGSAIAQADASQQQYPALVYGPSRSSEGFRLYYLIEWLEAE